MGRLDEPCACRGKWIPFEDCAQFAKNEQDFRVSVSPRFFCMTKPGLKQSHLKVKNKNPYPIFFKVLTTNKEAIRFKPVTGRISVHEKAIINVYRFPSAWPMKLHEEVVIMTSLYPFDDSGRSDEDTSLHYETLEQEQKTDYHKVRCQEEEERVTSREEEGESRSDSVCKACYQLKSRRHPSCKRVTHFISKWDGPPRKRRRRSHADRAVTRRKDLRDENHLSTSEKEIIQQTVPNNLKAHVVARVMKADDPFDTSDSEATASDASQVDFEKLKAMSLSKEDVTVKETETKVDDKPQQKNRSQLKSKPQGEAESEELVKVIDKNASAMLITRKLESDCSRLLHTTYVILLIMIAVVFILIFVTVSERRRPAYTTPCFYNLFS